MGILHADAVPNLLVDAPPHDEASATIFDLDPGVEKNISTAYISTVIKFYWHHLNYTTIVKTYAGVISK